MAQPTAVITRDSVGTHDGPEVDLGSLGVIWKIEGEESGGRFSVVDHPIPPRTLAAPLHRHRNEDEYSYVLTGTLGALREDRVVTAGPGTWVFKPRGEWHTFWNAGDTVCRIVATTNSLDQVWPDLVQDYSGPQTVIFAGSVDTGCGSATSAVGPFYCPSDQTAYFDPSFFDTLQRLALQLQRIHAAQACAEEHGIVVAAQLREHAYGDRPGDARVHGVPPGRAPTRVRKACTP